MITLTEFKEVYPADEINKQNLEGEKWGLKIRVPNFAERSKMLPVIKKLAAIEENKKKLDQEKDTGGALDLVSTFFDVIDELAQQLFPLVAEVLNVNNQDGEPIKDVKEMYRIAPDVISLGMLSVANFLMTGDKETTKKPVPSLRRDMMGSTAPSNAKVESVEQESMTSEQKSH